MVKRTISWFKGIKCKFGIHKYYRIHRAKSHHLLKCKQCGRTWIESKDGKIKYPIF